MMLEQLLALELQEKLVLDMGCGTGVLAILAAMKGAKAIDAIDIDPWCYQNTKENVAINKCHQIDAYEGDVSLLEDQKYDLIIANINRNILLKDIPIYVKHLNPGGMLIVSGFYTQDLDKISHACTLQRLKSAKKMEKNNWVAAKYVF